MTKLEKLKEKKKKLNERITKNEEEGNKFRSELEALNKEIEREENASFIGRLKEKNMTFDQVLILIEQNEANVVDNNDKNTGDWFTR